MITARVLLPQSGPNNDFMWLQLQFVSINDRFLYCSYIGPRYTDFTFLYHRKEVLYAIMFGILFQQYTTIQPESLDIFNLFILRLY